MDKCMSLDEIRSALSGRTFCIVPYMHPDWAWCHTREWHERRYVAVFEDVIAVMRRNVGYKWYMDCFRTEFMPLVERRPDLIEAIQECVKRGDIEIAGGFSNVRPSMVSDEAYIRNMIIGREKWAAYFPGAEIVTQAEAVDVALGHPQIPQLLQKGGFRYYRAGRPYEVLEKKGLRRDFYWEGLDGSKVLVWWGEYGGLWQPDAVRDIREKLTDWDALVRTLYDTELKQYLRGTDCETLWIPQGCDDVLPLKAFNSDIDVPLPEIIERWNQTENSTMRFTGPNAFFRALEARGDAIQTHKGTVEICDVSYNAGWGGEKGLVAKRLQSSERIAEAETWSLLAQQCADLPAWDARPLWEASLTASAHAAQWLFEKDFDDMARLIDKAILDAEDARDEALRALTKRIDLPEDAIAVAFNGLGFAREETVSLTVPSGILDGLRFTDGAGRALPFQILRPYEYTDAVWEHEALLRVALPALGYTVIRAQGVPTDCRLGGVFARPNAPETFGTARAFSLDNGALRLEFAFGRLARVFDHARNRYVPAEGDAAFNDLVYTCVDTDAGVLHAGPTLYERVVQFSKATILENGPLRWRVRLTGSDGRIPYAQEIALDAGQRVARFTALFDWPQTCGHLTCRVPVASDCALRGGIPFGSEEKDVDGEPYEDDNWRNMHRQWRGLFCAKDYARVISGGASTELIGLSGDRFYFFDRARRQLSYLLLNSARMIPGTWEDSVSRRSIESVGPHEVRYALRFGGAGEGDRETARAARSLRTPPCVRMPIRRAEGPTLPSEKAFLAMEPAHIELSALYADGDGAILRVFETDGAPAKVGIVCPARVISCVSENFIGDGDGRTVAIDGEHVRFPIQPHEIVTLRVAFARG